MVAHLSQTAYTFFTLGNEAEAIRTWEEILTIDPDNKEAKWALKEIKNNQGKIKGQDSDLKRRKVQELHATALKQYSRGELKLALHSWQKILVFDPENIRVKNNIRRVENELTIQRKSQ